MPQRTLRELRQARELRDAEIRNLVAKALHRGARTQDIADALKISRSTFWRRYTDELRRDDQPNPRSWELQSDRLANASSSGLVRSARKEMTVAEPVPAGSDVSAGTYKCTRCGYQLDVDSTRHLPPCPSCNNGQWQTLSGGDSVNDPYPDR
jgi:rubrerythrin